LQEHPPPGSSVPPKGARFPLTFLYPGVWFFFLVKRQECNCRTLQPAIITMHCHDTNGHDKFVLPQVSTEHRDDWNFSRSLEPAVKNKDWQLLN